MNTITYKGYTAKIEFDPDDNILLAMFPLSVGNQLKVDG